MQDLWTGHGNDGQGSLGVRTEFRHKYIQYRYEMIVEYSASEPVFEYSQYFYL